MILGTNPSPMPHTKLQRTHHAPLPKKRNQILGDRPIHRATLIKKKRQLLGSLLKDSFHTFPGLVPKLISKENT